MAKVEKQTKRYPTDLTDEKWSRIEPVLPQVAKTGRRRSVDLREVLNAIRYMTRSGGGWRMLPKDFPPGKRCIDGSAGLSACCCFRLSMMWR